MRVAKLLQLAAKLVPPTRRRRLETPGVGFQPSSYGADTKAGYISEKGSSSATSAPTTPPLEACPICHDPVGIPNPEKIIESWTSLHCGHRFGTVCLQTWLQESIERDQNANPSCPICRNPAKHPKCGHLVCPQDFEAQYMQYQVQRQWAQRRTERNRLRRREGHPLRPPPPPKRKADTIGECRTCEENAAYEARMRKMVEQVQARQAQQARDLAAGESSGSGRARGVKAILPSQIRLRSSSGESSISRVDGDDRRGRVRSMFCNFDGVETMRVPRSPTPAPPSDASATAARRGSI